ncbi:MAG: type II toxin-antitoxin system RelE family toxin [Candidatus Bipolaricaulia bacterium]
MDEAAFRELSDPKRYPAKVCRQLLLKALRLGEEPRPGDSQKLGENIYRVTIGEYRIIYEVDDVHRRVDIYVIDKRDIVYRRWKRQT